jgi:hypothetical protein
MRWCAKDDDHWHRERLVRRVLALRGSPSRSKSRAQVFGPGAAAHFRLFTLAYRTSTAPSERKVERRERSQLARQITPR